jgi:beta-glucosidase
MVITENGAAYPGGRDAGGVVDDDRVSYLARHVSAAADALAAGVNLRGYFVWSLLDNPEWLRAPPCLNDFDDQRQRPNAASPYQR